MFALERAVQSGSRLSSKLFICANRRMHAILMEKPLKLHTANGLMMKKGN